MLTVTSVVGWDEQAAGYGAEFVDVYDLVFPRDESADRAARCLLGLAGGVHSAAGPLRLAEFGVGTGRVALAVAASGAEVEGVDSSPEMLRVARDGARSLGLALGLTCADIRTWRPSRPVDLAYCVCATLSMLPSREDQRAAVRAMAEAVVPGGLVVIETHNPRPVLLAHPGTAPRSQLVPVAGLAGGLRSTSTVAPDRSWWSVHHRWTDPVHGRSREASEWSLLTSAEQTAALALEVGLTHRSTWSSWSAAPRDDLTPTYVSVFRAPEGSLPTGGRR